MERKYEFGIALLLVLILPVFGQEDYFARKMAMFPPGSGGSRLFLTHGEIRIAVNNIDGRFTTGTIGGKSLLFGYPSEGATSHAHFFVDDSVCGTYIADGGIHPAPAPVIIPPTVVAGSIVSRYLFQGVEFTQRITPTFIGEHSTALIEYTAVNTTSFAKRVGVLLFLDTMIGENDYAPIATEYGYFAVEREFVSPNIPTYWQAFESSPWQPPDSLIGAGILIGGSAVPPTRVVFGDFWRLRNVVWNYSILGAPYSDSALLMRWDSRVLLAGESRRMATYYGIGSAEITIGELNLSLSAPRELTVSSCTMRSPNPFPVNLLVSNASGVAIGGIRALLRIPDGCRIFSGSALSRVEPEELSIGGTGVVSWLVHLPDSLFPRDTSLCLSASVWGSGTDTFDIEWCIFVPGIDGRGPIAELLAPTARSIYSCDTLALMFRLSDPDSIEVSTIRVRVDGALLSYPYPGRMDFTPPILRCFVPVSEISTGEIEISLAGLTDRNGCPIFGVSSWLLTIDNDPPEAEIIEPSAGDTIIRDDFRVSAILSDASGINWGSLRWRINDTILLPSEYLSDTAFINPMAFGIVPEGLAYWHVCLTNISDAITGPCPRNVAPNECIDFYTNLSIPRAEIIEPAPGAFVSCNRQIIRSRITATSSDLDESSIRMIVNGTTYSITSPSLSFDGSVASFIPPSSFSDGQIVNVEFRASTVSGFSIPPLNWSFRVDLSSPEFVPISPPSSVFQTPLQPLIFRLSDRYSGIESDSVRFRIDAPGGPFNLELSSPGVSFRGDTVIINIHSIGVRLEHCSEVTLHVWAIDKANNCGANRLADAIWRIEVPCTPPVVGAPNIPPSTFVSCDTLKISVPIHDNEGLNVDSMRITVNGGLISIDGIVASFSRDSLKFILSRGAYAIPESVRIIASPIMDIFGNRTDGPIDLNYYWDVRPPAIHELAPCNSCILGSMPEIIGVRASDYISGIDLSRSNISLNGINAGFSDGLSYDGTWLSINASAFGSISSETLSICVHVEDFASVCGANFVDTCWVAILDNSSPRVTLIYPPLNAIVSCDPQEFRFTAVDEQGIDFSTLLLRAGDNSFEFGDPEITVSGDTIIFTASKILFEHGENSRIEVADLADALGNRIASPVGNSFSFDFQAPILSIIEPTSGNVLKGPKQGLIWVFGDDPSGVLHESQMIRIAGTTYHLGDPGFSIVCGGLKFDPKEAGVSFENRTQVCFGAIDNSYSCPNALDTCITVVIDPAVLQIINVAPSSGSAVSCDPFTLEINLYSEFGIDISSAEVSSEGFVLTEGNGLSFAGNVLTAQFPTTSLTEGIHSISVSGIFDTIGNAIEDTAFVIVIDRTPPILVDRFPEDGGTVSPINMKVVAVLRDELAGIDFNSLRIIIGGELFSYDDPRVHVSGDSVSIDISSSVFFGDVAVSLCVSDRIEMCEPNYACFDWSFNIDSEGPIFELIEPFDGAITHLKNQPIRVRIDDPDGISMSSISLTAGGVSWSIGSELRYEDGILMLEPNSDWRDNSLLNIYINASDALGNISARSLGSFRTDFSPPRIISTMPANRSSHRKSPENIRIVFADNLSGVDPTSIEIFIDSMLFVHGDPAMNVINDEAIIDLELAGIEKKAPDSIKVIVAGLSDNPPDYGLRNYITEPYSFVFYIWEKGCSASPRPFSPNDDSFYDEVSIITGSISETKIAIFTSSGDLVREAYAKGKWSWNGRDNSGKPMPQGIYLFTISDSATGKALCSGTIVLAR